MGCVPELRFKEFSGEWEEKKLEEIADINPKSENLPDNFIYIDLESVENGLLKQKNQISKKNAPSRAQRILEIEDILFQTVRPYQKNNLFFNFDDSFYVSSTGYAQLRAIGNPNFLFQIIHKESFVNEVLKRCTGTSYPAINSNDLKKIFLNSPSVKEQEKIANFLSKVDEKIVILEDKLQLWETYKKGIMQQLFSQQLRFKDDDGNSYHDWEEKNLENIANFSKGKGISKNDISDEGTECIRYGELYTTYGEKISEIVSKTNLPKEDLVLSEKYDIIIPTSGETAIDLATASCIMKKGVAIGGDTNILKTEENSLFLSYYLNNKRNEIASLAQGVSVVHLYASSIKKLRIKIPSLEEQEKIANFLIEIDYYINFINKELEFNKEFKKGLLQKMFC